MRRTRISSALVVLLVASACASGGTGGGNGTVITPGMTFNPADPNTCYAPLTLAGQTVTSLEQMAEACRTAASNASTRTVGERANAWFNAGQALVEIGDRLAATPATAPNASGRYLDGEGLLSDAIPDQANPYPAMLALARAQKGLGRYSAAQLTLAPLVRQDPRIGDPNYLLALRGKLEAARIQRLEAASLQQGNGLYQALVNLRDIWTRTDPANLPAPADSRNRETGVAIDRNAVAAIHEESRAELISLAGEISAAGLRETASFEDTQRALNALQIASPVDPTDAQTQLHIAETQLRLAILAADTSPSQFECQIGQATDAGLRIALQAYESATRMNFSQAERRADAYMGLGCIWQSLDGQGLETRVRLEQRVSNLQQAVRAFTAARESDPGWSRDLDLGRAHRDLARAHLNRSTGGIPTEARTSLANAIRNFESAISLNPGDDAASNRNKARIHLDIADAHLALKDMDQDQVNLALANIQAAVALDSNSPLPWYSLAEFHYEHGERDASGAPSAASLAAAETNYQQADALATDEANRSIKARAKLQLSRILTERGSSDWARVVKLADDALARTTSETPNRSEFEDQACLSRIARGGYGSLVSSRETPDEPDTVRRLCTTRGANASANLLKGMYHIRLSQYLSQNPQQGELQNAIVTFSNAVTQLDAQPTTLSPSQQRARARLEYGRGVAETCVGLTQIGPDRIAAIPLDERNASREFFRAYKVNGCRR